MSLLVDSEYTIYALRLAYLRKVDDHAGPRVITFPSIAHLPPKSRAEGSHSHPGSSSTAPARPYESRYPLSSSPSEGGNARNHSGQYPLSPHSHVVVAGLNDARYQPELVALHSPKLKGMLGSGKDARDDLFGGQAFVGSTHDNAKQNSGAGGLKYSTTIFGPGRTGALGMRVDGRRSTSGDVPRRRGKAGSKDDNMVSEEIDLSTNRANDDASNAAEVGISIPTRIQYTDRIPTKSYRSSSLRIPSGGSQTDPRLPEFRNRSSSQPQHFVPADIFESAEQSEGEEGMGNMEELKPESLARPPPPARPPRSPNRSDPNQLKTLEDENVRAPPNTSLFEEAGAVSSALPLRRRSASEGASDFLRKTSAQHKSSESTATMTGLEDSALSSQGLDTRRPSDASTMARLNSSSTLFLFPSPPPPTRRRDLSDRSQRGEGSVQHLSPRSATEAMLSSYNFPPNSSISPALRQFQKTLESSPLSMKEDLSESIGDNSHSVDSKMLSGGSSVRFGNSSVISSSLRDPNPIKNATGKPTLRSEEALDDSFDGVAASTSATRPRSSSSALGLQMDLGAELDGNVVATSGGGAQEKPNVSRQVHHLRVDGDRKRARADRSHSRHRGISEARKKEDWFQSLKSNPQQVMKRFESRPQRSGLSALLSKRSQDPTNPFAALYKGVAGGSVSGGSNTIIEVYFPFASQNGQASTRSMSLNIRKDATMEELIGYSLYCYTEENWQPRLDEGLADLATEEQREIKMSTVGWTLRIVEDGEVDDDYPAIDRTLLVGKFGADELAICEATPAQVRQNLATMPLIQRRLAQAKQTSSKQGTQTESSAQVGSTLGVGDAATATQPEATGLSSRPAITGGNGSAVSLANISGTPHFSSSALSKSAMGPATPSIFLRVLITPNAEVKYKTTLQVPSDMYLADVLETICRKRHLLNVDQWALIVSEKNIVVPLDRTVESLQGNHDLALVKRQDLGDQANLGALTGQSTAPNASIFKRISVPPPNSGYRSAKDLASTYKSYTVNRRQAAFLGRHERTLTIDGDWVHIIPTETKAFQAQSGASSFPVSAIITCTQSRLPSSFKLVIARENDQKRYDFEAESSKVAAEIVESINALVKRAR